MMGIPLRDFIKEELAVKENPQAIKIIIRKYAKTLKKEGTQ